MAKKKTYFTEIIVVLDKSGSMNPIKFDTIGGFNEFLKEQQGVEGKANLTLVQFDTSYEFTYRGVDIQEAKELSDNTYRPGGMTALLDAVGRGIIETENRITDMKKKPDQVIFMIITDGYENSSLEFTREQIAKLVKDKQDVEKWDFLFVGAGIDSFGEAGSLGMKTNSTANYDKSNVVQAYAAMSSNIKSYRSTNTVDTLNFSDEQRKTLKGKDKENT